jgi:hypothetical protein
MPVKVQMAPVWAFSGVPGIGCHLCPRQRIACGQPRGSHGVTIVRIAGQILYRLRQFRLLAAYPGGCARYGAAGPGR